MRLACLGARQAHVLKVLYVYSTIGTLSGKSLESFCKETFIPGHKLLTFLLNTYP